MGPDGASTRARVLADLTASEREAFLRRFEDRPGDFVGQEVVRLSTTPVLHEGRLEAAPFVLRVYAAATPEGMKIMPGGFCRTSDRPDVRAISMGEHARSADVWVLAEAPVERVSLMANRDDVKVRRILGHLPSRAADNLFWLGRYLERAEATLRLVRSLCTSLMDSDAALHSTGETLGKLEELLVAWDALGENSGGLRAVDAARKALLDQDAAGSVIRLVRASRRTASSMRERLSADFWTLLVSLENRLMEPAKDPLSEAERAAAGRGGAADPRRPGGPGPGEHEPRRRLALPRHGPADRARDQHLPLRPRPGRRRRHPRRPRPAARSCRQPDHLSRPLPGGPGADARCATW